MKKTIKTFIVRLPNKIYTTNINYSILNVQIWRNQFIIKKTGFTDFIC